MCAAKTKLLFNPRQWSGDFDKGSSFPNNRKSHSANEQANENSLQKHNQSRKVKHCAIVTKKNSQA